MPGIDIKIGGAGGGLIGQELTYGNILRGNSDNLTAAYKYGEFEDKTINVDNSMSAAEIQAEIDALGRYIAPGVTVTIQFADGSYNVGDTLSVSGFYGGGIINIFGNSNDNGLGTSQAVELGGNYTKFLIENCKCSAVNIRYMKLEMSTSNDIIRVFDNDANIIIDSCYIQNDYDTGGESNLRCDDSDNVTIQHCYMYGGKYGIRAIGGRVFSNNIHDVTQQPEYGLYAQNAATIGKSNNQPGGSIANETTSAGGEIR